ncbi:MAG TPA: glycoside hydrolase family 88 protein [Opitutaceae bacterium]
MKTPLAFLASLSLGAGLLAGAVDFGPWPAGQSPQEIGKRVATRFTSVLTHQNYGRPGNPERITYPEVCTWYGALTFAQATGDAELRAALVRRFEPLLEPTSWPEHPSANWRGIVDERAMVPAPDHVDHTVFAAVPLELYLQTKDTRYLALGRMMADRQWADPDVQWPFDHPVLHRFFPNRVTDESREWHRQGYSWQTRIWIDDMFMITAAQAQAYRATGDRKYIDRAAMEMVLYLNKIQRDNGLFHHAPGVPYFWGRGNGWMAAGSSELLRSTPADNPDRATILAGYRKMMATLLKYQRADGMWGQLIDDPESWPETSGTGMFAFAFIVGVKEGWLDEKTYGPAAKKAWLALTAHLDGNADLREVCQGTNIYNSKNPGDGPDGRAYYLNRQRIVGDLHGQAPVLWCATALLR